MTFHEKILPKSEILETEFNFAFNTTETLLLNMVKTAYLYFYKRKCYEFLKKLSLSSFRIKRNYELKIPFII